MPALADTGVPASVCGCDTKLQAADANPSGGRAVINEELSVGDEVVVEFVPSDLPASGQGSLAPAPSGGDTAISGGDVENTTTIDANAQGGNAASSAEGGDFNLTEVITGGRGDVEADAGSGGVADSAATGGAIVIGNVNSGNNQGSQIEVNPVSTGKIICFTPDGRAIVEVPTRLSQPAGDVAIDAGNVTNETNVSVDASGGNASSDASGGDGNIVVVNNGRGNVDASAGSGGTANADASGGSIVIGDINSGGNTGNVVTVGGSDSDDGKTDRQKEREARRAERQAARDANRQGNCAPPPCDTASPSLNTLIDGGDVTNTTDIAVDASGGNASSDASGGDDNIVEVNAGGRAVEVDVSAGSGGTANADASGGAVEIGNVRSGGNTGNSIEFANATGQMLCLTGNDSLLFELDLGLTGISGGNVTNETDINVDASGGNAASDASGGDGNIVISSGSGDVDASAGSGGTASSDASGGTIVIGDINSGGNSGNEADDD
jgi:hypothetical protein